jgi:hypothetical protein
MARDRQSIVKMSRREGYALHPKAHKALVKRTSKPGQGMQSRGGRGVKPANTPCSCVRSKKSSACTVYWKSSLAIL